MATEERFINPFVGPIPFERKDAEFFFGRAGEVQELVSLIVANRVVLLYAASGAGKTSLLNAGVVPLLEQQERFEVLPSVRFSRLAVEDEAGEPAENVYAHTTLLWWSERMVSSAEPTADALEAHGLIPAPPTHARSTLSEFLSARGGRRDARGRPLPRLVVFDQFEEIFTVNPEYWEHRGGFVHQLVDALDDDRHLHVVLALKEDHIAQLEPLLPLFASHVRFRLAQLTRDGAIEAVTGPVEKAGRTFAAGVAEALVHDLQTLRVERGREQPIEMSGEFVEPVQLQVVCQSLWSKLPPDADEITEEHTHTFGDVDEVLESFYNDAVNAAARAAHIRGRRLRLMVESAFITSVGTRSTVYRTAKSAGDIPNAAIDELEGRHLIRGDWRAGARWYELTHDRLIKPIQSSNTRFREELSRARRRRMRTVASVVAAAGAALGAAWIFTSAFAEPLALKGRLSLQPPRLNVDFGSYQQLLGNEPSGTATQRARNGNLVGLLVSTQRARGKRLVIEARTIEAPSGRELPDTAQRAAVAFEPQASKDDSPQELWIPSPARRGRFAYKVILTTSDGTLLDLARTQSFNVDARGASFRTNVRLLRLRVQKAGRGSGRVTSSPSGIDCGAACSSDYAQGTRVSLLPLPAPGSVFAGWIRGCSRAGACTVPVTDETTVVAEFARVVGHDVVAHTGGIGVRYRRSPHKDDLVPGNGPREGDRVTIYCYTKGEPVHDNPYWAKVALSPAFYVPASYLRHGNAGLPADVNLC